MGGETHLNTKYLCGMTVVGNWQAKWRLLLEYFLEEGWLMMYIRQGIFLEKKHGLEMSKKHIIWVAEVRRKIGWQIVDFLGYIYAADFTVNVILDFWSNGRNSVPILWVLSKA